VTVRNDAVALRRGVKGFYRGRSVEIQGLVGPDKILVVDQATSESHVLTPDQFKIRAGSESKATTPALHDVGKEWDEAERRYAAIEPLVQRSVHGARVSFEEIKDRAKVAGVHFTTVYRWIRDYENAGNRPSGLKPRIKNRGPRKKLLDPVVESLVTSAIQDLYLDRQQRTMKSTYEGVGERCRAAGVPTPHYNTVRKRILAIPEREKLSKRARRKLAADRYDPRPGTLVIERPWQLVEIDHTPTDLILVDDTHRRPIGRAHITAVIDVYSRMIAGFYVSLEPPSAATVGLALTRAMLPKSAWLAEMGLTADWPCYGHPAALHVDNALEFHGKMLHRVCHEYKMTLEFRPLKTPQFGGHIEAFFKTLAHKIHELPGTTFFSVEHRGEYPSDLTSLFSLDEFEKWLVHTIVEYHEAFHSTIKCSPKSRYLKAFNVGGDELPAAEAYVFEDPERLRVDFMPYEERTIQQYGVQFWKIRYYHSVLKRFINAATSGRNSAKRQFRFHYDPRNISCIYFYDPDLKQYFPIPYRNITNPRMSAWECREADRELNKAGRSTIDERAIVESVTRRRQIEREAAATSRSARRNAQRVASGMKSKGTLSVVPQPVALGEPAPDVIAESKAERRAPRPYLVEDL